MRLENFSIFCAFSLLLNAIIQEERRMFQDSAAVGPSLNNAIIDNRTLYSDRAISYGEPLELALLRRALVFHAPPFPEVSLSPINDMLSLMRIASYLALTLNTWSI